MAATADDIIAAMDRLTKAIQTATTPKPETTSKAPVTTVETGSSDTVIDQIQDVAGTAGDVTSGHIGRTVRGLRTAWKMWEKYGGKGGEAAAGEGEAAAGAEGAAAGGEAAAAGGEGAAAAGASGAAAAGPVGIAVLAVVAVLATLVIAFNKFRTHVEETTEELIRDQAKLAEVSGAMAQVYAERELRELNRDREVGNRLAGSTRYLAEGEQARKDQAASFQVLGTKLSNYLEGFGNRFLAGLYDPFSKIADRLDKLVDQLTGDKTPESIADWMEKIEKRETVRLDAAKKRMQDAAAAIDRQKG